MKLRRFESASDTQLDFGRIEIAQIDFDQNIPCLFTNSFLLLTLTLEPNRDAYGGEDMLAKTPDRPIRLCTGCRSRHTLRASNNLPREKRGVFDPHTGLVVARIAEAEIYLERKFVFFLCWHMAKIGTRHKVGAINFSILNPLPMLPRHI